MNTGEHSAREYLSPPGDGLWTWAEHGEVVVWRDGRTVGFRMEFLQVLESLAPNPLPPFGSVILLMAACRGLFPTVDDFLPQHGSADGGDAARSMVLKGLRGQLRAQVDQDLQALRRVRDFPESLISKIQAKRCLANAVFESARAERHANPTLILQHLRNPDFLASLAPASPDPRLQLRMRHVHLLAEGLLPFSTESLALRMRTSLDEIPDGSAVDRSPMEQARGMIEQLDQLETHQAIARAALNLLAAIRLPRALGQRDELALGGTSDITNRGPLDRLLLSELAHDDLTLSVRLALNEALYLRREPPANEPPMELVLLLDSGIRLWGRPRVLATAAALAFLALDRPCHRAVCWRAREGRVEPVNLLSHSGLEEHLAVLDTTTHPGAALAAFEAAIPSSDSVQSILITHPECLEDMEFRRALAQTRQGPGYIATVDRTGRFEVHLVPLRRASPVCSAQLDVEAIFKPRARPAPPVVRTPPTALPAFLSVRPFPVRVPLPNAPKFSVIEAGRTEVPRQRDAMLIQTATRQLARWTRGDLGVEYLWNTVPAGRTRWLGNSPGAIHVLQDRTNHHPPRLVSYIDDPEELRVIPLPKGGEIRAAFATGEQLIVIRSDSALGFQLGSGKALSSLNILPTWLQGRFFRSRDTFLFLRVRGNCLGLESVPMPQGMTPREIVTLFDREGIEGPWMVRRNGFIESTVTGESIQSALPSDFNGQVYRATILAGGNEVHLHSWPTQHTLRVQLIQPRADSKPSNSNWLNTHYQHSSHADILRSVEAIAALPDGLAFLSERGHWWKLRMDSIGKIRLEGPIREQLPVTPCRFGSEAEHVDLRCSLRRANLPNGSKAWLDNRGLVHLKSHDPDVPELSLMLSLYEVAAWSSDGKNSGPIHFFATPHPPMPSEIFAHLMQFRARL